MKKAFTMLEIIVVIVVVGILAAAALPRIKDDYIAEAADQVMAHIRYTQHLAMQDNKFDPSDPNWFKERWTITFNNADFCSKGMSWRYSVYNDLSGGGTGNVNSLNEIAKDPQEPNRFMTAGWSGIAPSSCEATLAKTLSKFDLGKKFGIMEIKFEDGCSGVQAISFDEFGRPMKKVATTGGGGAVRGYDRILQSTCKITLKTKQKEAIITMQPETGYIEVKYPNS